MEIHFKIQTLEGQRGILSVSSGFLIPFGFGGGGGQISYGMEICLKSLIAKRSVFCGPKGNLECCYGIS